MPLIKKITLEGGVVGLWKIVEQPEDFTHFAEKLKNDPVFRKIKHKKRKTEFLAIRALIEELTGEFPIIDYKSDGSPVLTGQDEHISISHSANMAAVILHKYKVGIDVEKTARPIGKIASKFLSEKELDFTKNSESPERAQIICWCAKEAIFKWAPEEGIDFASQIQIHPFQISNNGIINAEFFKTKHTDILLSYLVDSENIVVWCIKNIHD